MHTRCAIYRRSSYISCLCYVQRCSRCCCCHVSYASLCLLLRFFLCLVALFMAALVIPYALFIYVECWFLSVLWISCFLRCRHTLPCYSCLLFPHFRQISLSYVFPAFLLHWILKNHSAGCMYPEWQLQSSLLQSSEMCMSHVNMSGMLTQTNHRGILLMKALQ